MLLIRNRVQRYDILEHNFPTASQSFPIMRNISHFFPHRQVGRSTKRQPYVSMQVAARVVGEGESSSVNIYAKSITDIFHGSRGQGFGIRLYAQFAQMFLP